MSHTITIPDDLYSRLEATARRRGLGNIEQLLETLPGAEDDVARFQGLVQQWKKETAHFSNIGKKALHPAYQEIIGMGNGAVPLLLAELRRDPDDWFWALHAITGAKPVRQESQGNLKEMTKAWLQWGKGLDRYTILADNNPMNVTEKNLISAELLGELEEVLRNPYSRPDPKAMAKACKQIDKMREETRKKMGELNVAVDLIRDARR